MPKNIFNSLKRYVDRAKSNARSAAMRASYVDTRSDTTRKGYHEGRTRYGYNYGANENGITGTIARVIDGKDYNPYLQTGIAPMPDKIASPKDISRIRSVFKNLSKITPKQWTAAQDAAIAKGDMAEAQRLRDLHFKVKSNTVVQNNNLPLKTYHTVNESYPANFNVFNPNIEGTHSAIYTSDSPIMSGTYANSLISNEEKEYYIQRGIDNLKYLVENNLAKGDDLIKARNALKSTESAREYVLSKTPWLNTRPNPTRQKQLYVKLNNPLMIEGHSRNWNDIPIHELPKKVYDNLRASNMNGYTTRDIERAQKLAGYDGGIIKNITDYGSTRKSAMIERKPSTVYQINSPNNLKLADAVTYDDKGVRIPLGDRDNFNINDIRWSWLLPVFGVGAATAVNAKDKNKSKFKLGGNLSIF